MKYQYLVFDEASIIKLEIRVEYIWELVENPTHAYKLGCPMLLSIEAGTPTTLVLQLCSIMKSVKLVASVKVWEAPTKTSPSKFKS